MRNAIFLTIIIGLYSRIDNKKTEITNKFTSVLIYMIADNNLNYFANIDIKEMKHGWKNNPNQNILVYLDGLSSPRHPILFTFNSDSFYKDSIQIIKTYPEQNSAASQTLSTVIQDSKQFFNDSRWRLVLWSHGSAWLPSQSSLSSGKDRILTDSTKTMLTKSFGLDQEDELSIANLRESLSKHWFEWIAFDACYMGNIETLYELRHVTDYFIASPTEILSSGFPYDKLYSEMFIPDAKRSSLAVAKQYVSHYQQKKGVFQSASISVTSSTELDKLHKLYHQTLDKNTKQNLEIQYDIYNQNLLFDLRQSNPLITKQLSKTVLYTESTAKFLSQIHLKNTSGLSISIPDSISKLKPYIEIKEKSYRYWQFSSCRKFSFFIIFV